MGFAHALTIIAACRVILIIHARVDALIMALVAISFAFAIRVGLV